MRSRFDASRFDSSLVGLQWALRFVLLVMALLALAACSDDPTGNGREIVAVQVTAATSQVGSGDSLLLSARPRQADGRTRTDVAVSWFSTDTAVARVEGRAGQNAVVVGKTPGAVIIRAMAADEVVQAELTVIVTDQAAPVVSSMAPGPAVGGVIERTANGARFHESSLVRFNGVAMAQPYASGTELRGLVPAANLVQVGTAEVTVRTGPPEGGTSAGKPFSILPRVAAVLALAPDIAPGVGEQADLVAAPQGNPAFITL